MVKSNKLISLLERKTINYCLFATGLACFGSFFATSWPIKLGELYGNITNGSINSLIKGIVPIITFGLIYLASECLSVVRRVILDCIIASHEANTREKTIVKLLKLPVSYYSNSLCGEKTAQLNQGVSGLSQLIKILCNDIVPTILIAGCTLIQVSLNAPKILSLLIIFYLLITLLVSFLQINSQNGIRENILKEKNNLDGNICQSISNLEFIRSLNASEYERRRLLPFILKICNVEKRHHKDMGLFDCLKHFCKVFFQVIIIGMSLLLVSKEKMSVQTLLSVSILFQQLVKPMDEIYRFIDELASSFIKAKILLEISILPEDEIYNIVSIKEEEFSFNSDIVIKDVIVTNPEGNTPLAWFDNISLHCNKIIGLQGPNGSGKSSLLRSLNRYYPHSQGKIILFGVEQKFWDQEKLAQYLYYSPQNSFFIAGTVRENLVYGLERNVNDEELILALQKVHLIGEDHNDSVICSDADAALSYFISEKAEELSGGMKQRLSLARAFLHIPKLFVFDEITSNLDKNSINFLLDNIESYAKKINAGIIYISHDKNVVDRCQEILVLDNKLQKLA